VYQERPKAGKDFVRRNEQIRIPQVLLVYEGRNLGVMSNHEALAKARAVGLDLVEVSPHSRPPVCSIMDYGKYMFEKQKKQKTKQGGAKEEKEISFRYVIAENDLATKAGQIRRFLEKDIKVKVVIKFKQREKAHKDQGFVAMNRLLAMLEDIAAVEKSPTFEGSNIIARLDAKKGKKDGVRSNPAGPEKNSGLHLQQPSSGGDSTGNRNTSSVA
jgi:translation initiation factor IF-3